MNVRSTGVTLPMRTDSFQPSLEGEARLLLLIAAFSRRNRVLEGRTKLAKLDFLLRYPIYFDRALQVRRPQLTPSLRSHGPDVESRMVRYRYGPWDPAYFALLGRLIGKGLVKPAPFARGIGYRVTENGQMIATDLQREPAWLDVAQRVDILRRHFDLTGAFLKRFIYENFPEVTRATWGQPL